MKFNGIILLIFLISRTGSGQDTTRSNTSNLTAKLLLGINFSPDYCFRSVNYQDGYRQAASFTNKQIPKFGFTSGINLKYNFSKHFGIQFGLQYSSKGYAFDLSDLTFGDMIDPRFGFIYQTQTLFEGTPAKFVYNYNYLDIPLIVEFIFVKNKIHFITGIGITTNILLSTSETAVSKNINGDSKCYTFDMIGDYNALNISPTISAGVEYRLCNKINLRAAPTFQYGLIELIDSPIHTHLWNAGFNISCFYRLK